MKYGPLVKNSSLFHFFRQLETSKCLNKLFETSFVLEQQAEALKRVGVTDSIGIDLVAYHNPPLVIEGDFHMRLLISSFLTCLIMHCIPTSLSDVEGWWDLRFTCGRIRQLLWQMICIMLEASNHCFPSRIVFVLGKLTGLDWIQNWYSGKTTNNFYRFQPCAACFYIFYYHHCCLIIPA